DVELIFNKITELANLATREDNELTTSVLTEDANVNMNTVRSILLQKTHDIISKFSEYINNVDNVGVEKISELLQSLERSKVEIELLAAILKAVKKNNQELSLDQLINLTLEVGNFGQALDTEDQEQILAIAQENWQQNPKLQKEVVSELRGELQDAHKQKFYVLRYEGNIIGFVRFKEIALGQLYAGSLNIHSELRGLKVGEALMTETIDKEAEQNILQATASPRIQALSYYVERLGFVIDGIIENYHGTGEPLLTISCDRANNKKYNFRNEGKDIQLGFNEIKKQAQEVSKLDSLIGQDSIILAFDIQRNFEAYNEAMKKLLPVKADHGSSSTKKNEGVKYKITRCLKDVGTEDGDLRYFVFEKIN
ncbi:MAG: GNAT family N-acetyltransferase, partial [bacterium]|nr:GNAT family N-acetyltransferase [bacterium]